MQLTKTGQITQQGSIEQGAADNGAPQDPLIRLIQVPPSQLETPVIASSPVTSTPWTMTHLNAATRIQEHSHA